MSNLKSRPCSDPHLITQILDLAHSFERIGVDRFSRQVLLDPNFREEGSLVIYSGDEPAGYCWAVKRRTPLENADDDSDKGYIVLFGVMPPFRRKGLGRLLLEHAEQYLAQEGCTECLISPYAPGYFTPGVDVAEYAEGVRFLKRRGYGVQSRPLSMELDLTSYKVPDHVPSETPGIEFTAYSPELTVPLLNFASEEFKGDWVRFARDAARAILNGNEPGRLQIALREGEVVGFSHYQNDRFGPIGVSKAIEGKGVGSQLMRRTLESMKSAGHRRAYFLWTDDATAKRFYEPWGWKEWRRFEVLGRKLLP